MRAAVGVTDSEWAALLRADDSITEANFWVPSGGAFRALQPGEPFLFKTKAPHNALVGGGFFESFWELRVSEAWTTFGPGNGVASEEELHAKIGTYRERTRRPHLPDPTIGCVILRNLFFAPPGGEFPQPPDWGRSIMQWKTYDLDSSEGEYVKFAFETLQGGARVDYNWDSDLRGVDLEVDTARFGKPILTAPRLGQGTFRLSVLTAYENRCAITGSRIAPALQAAHIRPYSAGGRHAVSNGLVLRSDVHTLFDRGYLSVDPDYRLRVSPRLRTDFGNGVEFYDREERGEIIRLPGLETQRPDRDALAWRMDKVFLSA